MVSMKVNAQSRMDFLNKLNIALKEADEIEYWLDLLHETKYLDDNLYKSINGDCTELITYDTYQSLVMVFKKILPLAFANDRTEKKSGYDYSSAYSALASKHGHALWTLGRSR